MPFKSLLQKLGFEPKDGTSGIFHKKYPRSEGYYLEVDFDNEKFNYGDLILFGSKTTLNFFQAENWVVLECVDRLLEKGYKPQNITLEKVYPAGHGHSGRLDICVTHDDGSEYLLIECKTYGKEFDNAVKKINKDGGQLFTYFKFSNKADVIILYASEFKGGKIYYKNEIIKIEDDYRTGDVKDFYEKWSKLTKDNGVFDSWVTPYNFESKALTINDLEEIKQEDSSFIFNRFLEILRHNVVSDKGNAFNRIFTLFLCKIYDEKINEGTDSELGFQWLEGIDDHRSFQIRLTDLYKNGMHEFLEKVVTDFSETEFNNKFKHLEEGIRNTILGEFNRIRLEKNNEFAIKDVYDEQSFNENAVVVKEIVQLLEKYKLRYTKKQQYLSDFFELLLTTGLKQESGQFFTPVPVAQFVIKSLPVDTILEDKLSGAKIDNDTLLPYVMDYAAGSGHFLTETMHEMQRLIKQKDNKKYHPSVAKKIRSWQDDHFAWAIQYVYGIEKDYRLVKVGKVGCYLHGDGLANVIHSDGLARFNHPHYKGKLLIRDKDFPQDNKQFDIIVSNPPYSVSAFKNAARSFYKDEDFELYRRLSDVSSEIECLFIERTKQLLKDGGVAGVILPSSILSNSGIYSKAREIILCYFELIGIAELGSNTFMATGTNTVTLFLKRRNNYECINLKKAIEKFFSTLSDVTIRNIEKPVAKYVNYVWEGVSFEDYLTLLSKAPNKIISENDLYKEYRKKIKAKNEIEFWDSILERESEKLFYFIITCQQKVVLIKSGEKDAEKRFLGYEFSNRRGSEGIHPIQRGKSIEECTQLFDAETFDNPTKASTYIYKAFQGDFDFPIDATMQNNITRHNLVDMLTFDRVDFEKNVSLSVKKKVNIESKWEIKKLGDLTYNLDNKRVPLSQREREKGEYPYYGATGIIDYVKDYIFDEKLVLIGEDGAKWGSNENSSFIVQGKYWVNNHAHVLKPKDVILHKYLSEILNKFDLSDYITGLNVPKLNQANLNQIQIPLPPISIQEKIVKEIEDLEAGGKKLSNAIDDLKVSANNLFNFSGSIVKLQDITVKIGSGSTPRGGELSYVESGITLIRSQNVYDNEFYPKGLAFIDDEQAKKLDGVTVEENDILFNITGASVCRCCIVDKSYLPARVNQHVAIIRTTEKVLPKFLQQLLISGKFKTELLALSDNSSTREAITKAQLEDFKVPIPSISDQIGIVNKIEEIEKKISALQAELEMIPQKKEDILQKHL